MASPMKKLEHLSLLDDHLAATSPSTSLVTPIKKRRRLTASSPSASLKVRLSSVSEDDVATQQPPFAYPGPAHPPTAKRKTLSVAEDVFSALRDFIRAGDSVEAAILRLVHQYNFDFHHLQNLIDGKIQLSRPESGSCLGCGSTAKVLDVSFSRVGFDAVAPLVGLRPEVRLRDASSFLIRRARIPNDLFARIVDDIQVMVNNYGPHWEHENEEATSRAIAPLVTRIVAEFKLLIRNSPESIIEGRITRKGRVEYLFQAFGCYLMVFIETKQGYLSGGSEYMDAVAQAIAEADVCHFINSQYDLCCPVYVILCDGSMFEFFRFDREDTPQVARGMAGFKLPVKRLCVPIFGVDLTFEFLVNARRVCETIFSILLLGYKQALQAYYNRFMKRAKQRGEQQQSPPEWLKSIEFANEALTKALDAADLHASDQIVEAENMALQASIQLQASLMSAPPIFRREDVQLQAKCDMDTLSRC